MGVGVSYPDIVGFWTNYKLTAPHLSDHTKLREVVTKMIKAISSYFPAITREEKERKELKDKQVARALTEMNTKVASEITTAVNDVIIIDDYDVGDVVIDSFREILTQIEPVTTSTQRTAAKRHPNINVSRKKGFSILQDCRKHTSVLC